jgi:D-amino-acid oxidase
MVPKPETIVVGCGVSGLSSAIRLLENGFPTRIVARDLPPHTTSNVAAAVWYPYQANPVARALRWGQVAVEAFEWLLDVPEAGVSSVTLVEMFAYQVDDPWWKLAVRRFRRAMPADLPDGYVDGYVADVPMIETPVYMRYLVDRFEKLGGTIEQRTVESLAELLEPGRLVVNCTGLGARQLTDDESMYPIRGQVVSVRAPAAKTCLIDQPPDRRPAYVIPRTHDVVVGGTAEEGEWGTDIDPHNTEIILEHAKRLEPALENAEVLDVLVGLRPGRPTIRLEMEHPTASSAIIHNYGHSGAGFTLSWGCAAEVLDLAQTFAAEVAGSHEAAG